MEIVADGTTGKVLRRSSSGPYLQDQLSVTIQDLPKAEVVQQLDQQQSLSEDEFLNDFMWFPDLIHSNEDQQQSITEDEFFSGYMTFLEQARSHEDLQHTIGEDEFVDGIETWLEQFSTSTNGPHPRTRMSKMRSLPNKSSRPSILPEYMSKMRSYFSLSLWSRSPRMERSMSLDMDNAARMIADIDDPLDVKEMIGRKEEKEKIVELLLDVYEHGVIRIAGIKGIGKTALAKLVYNDDRVEQHFQLRFWVCVSRTFDIKLTMKKVSEPEQEEEMKAQDISELKNLVQGKIDSGRWLLVLDDVGHESYVSLMLQQQLQVLLDGAGGSKILITTRHREIAWMVTRKAPPFILTGLSEKDAMSLINKVAYKETKRPMDPRKTAYLKEIVRKYKGYPPVMKRVGSSADSIVSLQKLFFVEDIDSVFERIQSIYSEAEPVSLKIHNSSFGQLPPHLRVCVAYCTLFPPDREINVQTLINLWMAQGLIKTSDEESDRPEDIGHSYLMRLCDKDFLQEVQQDELGMTRSCKMQEKMHNLIYYFSQGKIVLMDPYGTIELNRSVRHITLDFNIDLQWKIPAPLLEAHDRLRTILFSAQSRLPQEQKLRRSTCDAIFSTFKELRALDLHDLGMKVIPNSLGELKDLRYLGLSKNNFVTLPRSTTDLSNLQTLKLSDCHMLRELPKGFNKLVNLRHLQIDGCFALTQMPPGIEKLASLQTLSTFVVCKAKIYNSVSSNGGLEALNNLNDLRGELEISHLERVKCDASKADHAFLKEKQHLQFLTLRWDRDGCDDWGNHRGQNDGNDSEWNDKVLLKYLQPHPNIKALSLVGFNGEEFQSWGLCLPNLVKLSLFNCSRCQFLPPLHRFPSLETLELERLEELKFIADFKEFSVSAESTDPFFPSLKVVTLWDCPKLLSWWKPGRAFPGQTAELPHREIQKLEIQYCPKLKRIPFYPEMLILVCCSVDQLDQMMMKMAERSSSLSLASSSSSKTVKWGLKSLSVGKIEELKSLPEKHLKNFTSLHHLHIQDCHKLTSLSECIQHLSSLEHLNIENCLELVLSENARDNARWKRLKNLRSLTIRGIPKLKSLPNGLSGATSLKDLRLYSCPNLESLPKWVSKLNLNKMTIENCHILLPRCQQETGEDWPQIANIKHISVK